MSKALPIAASLGLAALSLTGCHSDYGDDFPTTAIMNGGDRRDEVIIRSSSTASPTVTSTTTTA